MKITAGILEQRGACGSEVKRFKRKWPRGASMSRANIREAAMRGFSTRWAARRLLSPVGRRAWDRAEDRATRRRNRRYSRLEERHVFRQTYCWGGRVERMWRQAVARAVAAWERASADALWRGLRADKKYKRGLWGGRANDGT